MKFALLSFILYGSFWVAFGIPVPASDNDDVATTHPLSIGCRSPRLLASGHYSTDECLDLYKRVNPARLQTTINAVKGLTRLFNKAKATTPGAAQVADLHTYRDKKTVIKEGDIGFAKVDKDDMMRHPVVAVEVDHDAPTIKVAKMSNHPKFDKGRWDRTKTVDASQFIDTTPGTGSVKPSTKLHLAHTEIAPSEDPFVEKWRFNGRTDHQLTDERLSALKSDIAKNRAIPPGGALKQHEPLGIKKDQKPAAKGRKSSSKATTTRTKSRKSQARNKGPTKSPVTKTNARHKSLAAARKPAPHASAKRPSKGDPRKKGGK